jgi:hypothetical protein
MKWHRNDEIDAQFSEPVCLVSRPESANALSSHLSASALHCEYQIAKCAIVRSKAEDRFEGVTIVAAVSAPERYILVLAYCAGAPRTCKVRVGGQRHYAGQTKIVACFGHEVATPGADGRVNKLTQSASDVE